MKLRIALVFLFLLAIRSDLVVAEPWNQYPDWPHMACTAQDVDNANQYIIFFQQKEAEARNYVQRCGGGPGGFSDCVQYMINKGYNSNTARSTCEGITSESFSCLSGLIDRGFNPNTARQTCVGLTRVESDCVVFLVDRRYNVNSTRQYCVGLTYSEYDCFRNLVNRGYTAQNARNTCKQ